MEIVTQETVLRGRTLKYLGVCHVEWLSKKQTEPPPHVCNVEQMYLAHKHMKHACVHTYV